MIVFINLHGGQVSWHAAPALLLISYLLNGGVNQLLGALFYLADSVVGATDSFLSSLLALVFVCIIVFLTLALWKLVAPTRLGQVLRQVFFTGFAGAGNAAAAGAAAAGRAAATAAGNQQQQHQSAQQRQQRWDKVVKTLQALPTDSIITAAELQQQTAHQLKQKLVDAGVSCEGCLEKQELIDKLLQIGGSSASSCSICCEEYATGDVVRVLPCKHRYHIECIDRWFLSSTDYSRPPACPMCNAELQLQ